MSTLPSAPLQPGGQIAPRHVVGREGGVHSHCKVPRGPLETKALRSLLCALFENESGRLPTSSRIFEMCSGQTSTTQTSRNQHKKLTSSQALVGAAGLLASCPALAKNAAYLAKQSYFFTNEACACALVSAGSPACIQGV